MRETMTEKSYTTTHQNHNNQLAVRFNPAAVKILYAVTIVCFLLSTIVCATGCKKDTQTSVDAGAQKTKQTPTVVILGSSTAAGVGADPIDSAWADIIQSTINQKGVRANFINLAFGGYTTYDVMPNDFTAANRPTPDTARNITKALSFKPALVMISLPSNDIADGFSDTEILNNYAKLIAMLDSAKVQYIIFSTQPRDFSDSAERMRLYTLNNELVSAYPNHINNFLNQLSTSTFQIDPIYSAGDGIHLNDAGHRVIANATLKQPILTSIVQ